MQILHLNRNKNHESRHRLLQIDIPSSYPILCPHLKYVPDGTLGWARYYPYLRSDLRNQVSPFTPHVLRPRDKGNCISAPSTFTRTKWEIPVDLLRQAVYVLLNTQALPCAYCHILHSTRTLSCPGGRQIPLPILCCRTEQSFNSKYCINS